MCQGTAPRPPVRLKSAYLHQYLVLTGCGFIILTEGKKKRKSALQFPKCFSSRSHSAVPVINDMLISIKQYEGIPASAPILARMERGFQVCSGAHLTSYKMSKRIWKCEAMLACLHAQCHQNLLHWEAITLLG